MEIENYLRLSDLNNSLYSRMLESQSNWLKHLSLLSSTLLGLLIGLYDKPDDNPIHFLCMALGASTLSISVLCSLILLFFSMPWSSTQDYLTFRNQASKCDQSQNCFLVYGRNPPKWTACVRIAMYVALGLSFVLFALSFWI